MFRKVKKHTDLKKFGITVSTIDRPTEMEEKLAASAAARLPQDETNLTWQKLLAFASYPSIAGSPAIVKNINLEDTFIAPIAAALLKTYSGISLSKTVGSSKKINLQLLDNAINFSISEKNVPNFPSLKQIKDIETSKILHRSVEAKIQQLVKLLTVPLEVHLKFIISQSNSEESARPLQQEPYSFLLQPYIIKSDYLPQNLKTRLQDLNFIFNKDISESHSAESQQAPMETIEEKEEKRERLEQARPDQIITEVIDEEPEEENESVCTRLRECRIL